MGRKKKQKKISSVKDFEPAYYNPRTITVERLQMLKDSMGKFGDLSGIVLNRKTGNIIGGHQRVKNFDPSWLIDKKESKDDLGTVAIGYIETPFGKWAYREVEWDEDKERAANVAANNHGGEFDEVTLAELVRELDGDLQNFIGFDGEGLESLLGEFEVNVVESVPSIAVNEKFGQITFTFTVEQKEEIEFMLNDVGEEDLNTLEDDNPHRNASALMFLVRNRK